MTLLAHAGHSLAFDHLSGEWVSSPAELVPLVVVSGWYALGVRRLWRRAGAGHGVSRLRAGAFAGGLAALVIALLSPLDALAESLFSVHMVQHLVLILVAAPLLVSGTPVVPMVTALPVPTRRGLGRWWHLHSSIRSGFHLLTTPGVAFGLHLVMLWTWHFPRPYQLALESPAAHAAEHLSFLLTAMLFWWVVGTPMGRRRTSEGAAILMVGGTLMQSGALGALLMFAPAPWYPAHAAGARAAGMTLMEDQQLAGLIMWIPAGVVYVGAAAWLFLRWMRRDEQASDAALNLGGAMSTSTARGLT
jgi:cytochrome c oxidase assembly factor CtaG